MLGWWRRYRGACAGDGGGGIGEHVLGMVEEGVGKRVLGMVEEV